MTKYEFSNESFNTDYAGMANAYWYGWSLGQWAPVLKGMLPSMQIGANGKPAWNSQGAADVASNNGALWWQQAPPLQPSHTRDPAPGMQGGQPHPRLCAHALAGLQAPPVPDHGMLAPLLIYDSARSQLAAALAWHILFKEGKRTCGHAEQDRLPFATCRSCHNARQQCCTVHSPAPDRALRCADPAVVQQVHRLPGAALVPYLGSDLRRLRQQQPQLPGKADSSDLQDGSGAGASANCRLPSLKTPESAALFVGCEHPCRHRVHRMFLHLRHRMHTRALACDISGLASMTDVRNSMMGS